MPECSAGLSDRRASQYEIVQRFTLRKETLRKEPFGLPLEPLGLIGMLSLCKRVDCPLQRLAVTAILHEALVRAELASCVTHVRHVVDRAE